MELRQLQYFAAVAAELHFGHAAARLHVSQSALSQQVRALERELGVRLFERTTRAVRLTPVGHGIHEQVKTLLTQSERTTDRIRRLAAGSAGQLRIGFVPSAAYDLLPRIVAPFGRASPDVELVLREAPTSVQLDRIAAGDLDVGLIRDIPEAPEVRLLPLVSEPLILACPRDHPAAARRRVRLASLRGERFIVLPAAVAPAMYAVIDGLARAAGVDLSPALEALAFPTTLGLVASGMGVAIVPASVRANHPPGLVYRPLTDPGAVTQLSAAVSGHRADPLVDQFLRTAQTMVER